MKTGLFAGTFDPPTLGHLEIIQRATSLCSKLYLGVALSENKQSLFFSQNKRIDFLKSITKKLKNVEVFPINGLVVSFAKEHHIDFLIRGLRNVSDFNLEMEMAYANRQMSGIETVFLIASSQYCHISSSLIREIAQGGGRINHYLPKEIENEVFNSFHQLPNLGSDQNSDYNAG